MGLRYEHFEKIEKNAVLLGVLIAIAVSIGGIAEITPLFIKAQSVKPAPGIKPYEPLRLAGRDIYVREGCYVCHSQMIRTQRFETQRYGAYSVLGESVYDRPFQWGSKRTGPDLARIGGKYSDEWQRLHLVAPRTLVPESNMPNYPWLAKAKVDGADVQARMRALRAIGDPYADADIDAAPAAVKDKSELDAVVAYLQGTGRTPGFRGDEAMSPIWGHALGVVTVLLLLVVCGISIWAWLPHHEKDFDALARLPMKDGDRLDQAGANER